MAMMYAHRGQRRVSLGGFALVEDEDFMRAMAKLHGGPIIASPHAHAGADAEGRRLSRPPSQAALAALSKAERAEREAAEAEGQQRAGASSQSTLAQAAAADAAASVQAPYWQSGPALDLSVYAPRVVHRRRSVEVDVAVTAANPHPRMETLAVPPPDEIMHPAGNSSTNTRIARCLVRNEVASAQQAAADPDALADLFADPAFLAAAAAVGYEPHALQAAPAGSFRHDPITGRERSRAEEEAAAAEAHISRLKHLALTLTEYKEEIARSVRVRRQASQEARARAARHKGGPEAGLPAVRPPSPTHVYPAGSADSGVRFISISELGPWSMLESVVIHKEERHVAAPTPSAPPARADLYTTSMASLPDSIPESIMGGGGSITGGGPEEEEEALRAEAEAVGLDPATLAAALAARHAARRRVEELTMRAEAVAAAAWASLAQGGGMTDRPTSRTSRRGGSSKSSALEPIPRSALSR